VERRSCLPPELAPPRLFSTLEPALFKIEGPTTAGAAGTAFQRGLRDHHDAATDEAADQAFAGRISGENGPVTVGHLGH
jgi:hypothetical protein